MQPPRIRTCIFCGGTPLTLEHNPPQWIEKSYPWATGTKMYAQTPNGRLPRGESRDIAAFKFKCVCKTCNNSWMSQLEELVKPTLRPMIEGRQTALYAKDQNILAAWLVKAALTFAPSQNWDNVAKFRDLYDQFHQQKAASTFYRIEVAACESSNLVLSTFGTAAFDEILPDRSLVPQKEFFYGLLIGHFCATVTYRAPRFDQFLPTWPGQPFIRIWPIKKMRNEWPPEPVLSRQMIENIFRGPYPRTPEEQTSSNSTQ